jgi:hypothetical protein
MYYEGLYEKILGMVCRRGNIVIEEAHFFGVILFRSPHPPLQLILIQCLRPSLSLSYSF